MFIEMGSSGPSRSWRQAIGIGRAFDVMMLLLGVFVTMLQPALYYCKSIALVMIIYVADATITLVTHKG